MSVTKLFEIRKTFTSAATKTDLCTVLRSLVRLYMTLRSYSYYSFVQARVKENKIDISICQWFLSMSKRSLDTFRSVPTKTDLCTVLRSLVRLYMTLRPYSYYSFVQARVKENKIDISICEWLLSVSKRSLDTFRSVPTKTVLPTDFQVF